MKKVTLHFKKEDFNNSYYSSKHCAITTALKRACINAEDVGGSIQKSDYSKEIHDLNTYNKMKNKVCGMYAYLESLEEGCNKDQLLEVWGISKIIEPRDFQATLLLDIEPSKEEIIEYMTLHNSDEAGIDNQWTFEDAEYHLLLSDKYNG